jgi:hypothetical protein
MVRYPADTAEDTTYANETTYAFVFTHGISIDADRL